MSQVPPQFDPMSRTMKVRVEMANPGALLRPDMYVDAELLVERPEALTVPVDAIVDSGLRRTVFVEAGEGVYEPRPVETGWRAGGRVEVLSGLAAGDRIVVSGTFLVDSESQLRATAARRPKGPRREGPDLRHGRRRGEGARRGQGRDPRREDPLLLLRLLQGELPREAHHRGRDDPGRGPSMIDRIIEFSVRNRFLVFALTAAACLWGYGSMRHVALDAIPDLSDTQVIVYSKWDRSPDLVEDQVTYPIVTAMLGAPKVKAVRGYSDFGYSFVYVVFEDGTDIYWARSRTLELLSSVLSSLPQGVKTEIGPDATALGWVFQYVLEDPTGTHGLAEMRSAQDWYLRYHLKSVPGVAEVASLGGFVQQYQVNLDPNRLRAHGIPIGRVVEAVKGGNGDSGGRLLEIAGAEYMVRGRGYARSVKDFEDLVLATSEKGAPIRVRDVGQVVLGPEMRRGVADLDGKGDAVSGIVVMRQGENALQVIERVKKKLAQVAPGLPAGVKVVPIYDRSELIHRSMDTLQSTLVEVLVTVSLVILLFLWHLPSAIIPLVTIPVAVLLSFIPFQMMGITANIMSLGGIAIAIGALVDAAIVVVEQTHKGLEEWERKGRPGSYVDVVIAAVKQVGPTSFFALLIIGVSFLPVLALEAQEGRLFKPLAYTKNLAMIIAAFLAITLDPALRVTLTHFRVFDFKPRWLARVANVVAGGKVHPEEHHPVSRFLIARLRAGGHLVAPERAGSSSGARWRSCSSPSPSTGRSARSSCPRSTRGPSSTCRRPCPASPSPRPRSCFRSRTAS